VGLFNCVECKKEVSISAGNCPHCGSKKPFKGLEILKKEQKGLTYKERKSFIKSGGNLQSSLFEKLSVVIIIGASAFFIFKPDAPLTAEQQEEKELKEIKSSAKFACYKAILNSLYVPESYERIGDSVWEYENDKNVFGAMISYKAQNKFGVSLSSSVTCTIKKDNGSFVVTAMEKTK
jgi:DNA-directed RNA polymerase subunit RPC12/RpoP